eukprot:6293268-Amphidinium_carterae.3
MPTSNEKKAVGLLNSKQDQGDDRINAHIHHTTFVLCSLIFLMWFKQVKGCKNEDRLLSQGIAPGLNLYWQSNPR